MENPRLKQALASWKDWPLDLSMPPGVVSQLNGFTNQSVVLDTGNHQLVLRLNRTNANLLGIHRDQEYLIWQSLADIGIAPELLYTDRQQDYVIYPFIEGRIWSSADLLKPDQLRRLTATISTYQAIRPEIPARNYIDYLEHYWQQLESVPAITPELEAQWHQFLPELRAFQESGWTPVLSHHDLIPENIIDDGKRLYIVDWEYAAMGHPDLDRCCINENIQSPARPVINWINRLWWLLADTSQRFNTGN